MIEFMTKVITKVSIPDLTPEIAELLKAHNCVEIDASEGWIDEDTSGFFISANWVGLRPIIPELPETITIYSNTPGAYAYGQDKPSKPWLVYGRYLGREDIYKKWAERQKELFPDLKFISNRSIICGEPIERKVFKGEDWSPVSGMMMAMVQAWGPADF